MKLLQVNVWQGRIARPLAQLIRDEAPDLICAQEIFSYPEAIPASSPWAYLSTLSQLADLGYPHAYFTASSTFPMFGRTLSYGNAILSKYPLDSTSSHYTGGAAGPQQYDQPGPTDHNATRHFQHAKLHVGRATLNLINHHGHWADNPLGDATSTARLEQLSAYIGGLAGPVIVSGDLNLSPDSPALQKFEADTGLRRALAGTGVTTTLSAAHYLPKAIICDHIYYSPDLKLTLARTSDRIVSDHKAVIAEFAS